jgi:hypothetical protein
LKNCPQMARDNSTDWNESHDVYKGKSFDILGAQRLWHESNVKIRNSIAQIESDVDKLIANGLHVSPRIYSYSSIGRGARLTRITVCHPDRVNWVDAERDRLKLKAKGSKQKTDLESKYLKLKKESKNLKIQLYKQREETLYWILKANNK